MEFTRRLITQVPLPARRALKCSFKVIQRCSIFSAAVLPGIPTSDMQLYAVCLLH